MNIHGLINYIISLRQQTPDNRAFKDGLVDAIRKKIGASSTQHTRLDETLTLAKKYKINQLPDRKEYKRECKFFIPLQISFYRRLRYNSPYGSRIFNIVRAVLFNNSFNSLISSIFRLRYRVNNNIILYRPPVLICATRFVRFSSINPKGGSYSLGRINLPTSSFRIRGLTRVRPGDLIFSTVRFKSNPYLVAMVKILRINNPSAELPRFNITASYLGTLCLTMGVIIGKQKSGIDYTYTIRCRGRLYTIESTDFKTYDVGQIVSIIRNINSRGSQEWNDELEEISENVFKIAPFNLYGVGG